MALLTFGHFLRALPTIPLRSDRLRRSCYQLRYKSVELAFWNFLHEIDHPKLGP